MTGKELFYRVTGGTPRAWGMLSQKEQARWEESARLYRVSQPARSKDVLLDKKRD